MGATCCPIRILHVFGIMNCGGAETFIMNIYRNIDREKVQFDFIVHSNEKGYYDQEIESLGGRIYSVPKFKGVNFIEYIKAWKDFFCKHKEYEIVHSHIRSTASIFLSIARKRGLVTIIHSHSISSGKGISAFAKDILQAPLRFIAEYRFACSNEAGEWLFGNRYFDVIKNAIDTQKYIYNPKIREAYRENLDITNKLVIGNIGRFYEPKNHKFIVEIFKSMFKKHPDSILLLVGDGKLKGDIESNVKKLGLEKNVIFTGVRDDIPELLQAMDIFLFPSLYEGLGIVAIEAQAAGLPCIISDKVPKEVVVTDTVEFMSLQKSADEWADYIRKCYDSHQRGDTSEKINKAGYDVRKQADFLLEFYLKVVSL